MYVRGGSFILCTVRVPKCLQYVRGSWHTSYHSVQVVMGALIKCHEFSLHSYRNYSARTHTPTYILMHTPTHSHSVHALVANALYSVMFTLLMSHDCTWIEITCMLEIWVAMWDYTHITTCTSSGVDPSPSSPPLYHIRTYVYSSLSIGVRCLLPDTPAL